MCAKDMTDIWTSGKNLYLATTEGVMAPPSSPL